MSEGMERELGGRWKGREQRRERCVCVCVCVRGGEGTDVKWVESEESRTKMEWAGKLDLSASNFVHCKICVFDVVGMNTVIFSRICTNN